MAKNSKSSGRGAKRSSSGPNGHRFIEYDLTSNDRQILRDEYSESDFGYDLVEDLIHQGYKYSCSFSEASSCFIATLTDKRKDSQFLRTSVSGRGATIAHSRMSLLYRHFVVAQEDWHILDSSGPTNIDDFG